ncbi:MAG: hypothetical protein ACOY3L_05325 [Pseudomonadota bacterium]
MQKQNGLGGGNILRTLRVAIFALALAWVPFAASAIDTGQTKTVDGLTIYIGAIPAEIVKGHPGTHPEAGMHDGPPSGRHEYHLVVALFDAKTGTRISDATMFARVSSLGLVGPRKALTSMKIEDTITYGNYFNLPDRGLYTIDLEIKRASGTIKVGFSYEH